MFIQRLLSISPDTGCKSMPTKTSKTRDHRPPSRASGLTLAARSVGFSTGSTELDTREFFEMGAPCKEALSRCKTELASAEVKGASMLLFR
jgi:hypothetical protein